MLAGPVEPLQVEAPPLKYPQPAIGVEAGRRSVPEPAHHERHGLFDDVDGRRLGDGPLSRLDTDDVLRILEWEVFYLQGLDVPRDHSHHPAPVAGSSEAISFIVERSGGIYEPSDVADVLAGEAEYLVGIGAVGSPVGEVE